MSSYKPIEWQAEIVVDEPTEKLKQEVANVVEFPENKTPDLLFFHGIMVSTGTNLNDAHFLGSEIIKADSTIDLKALDMEHSEDVIVGHIYSHKIVGHDGTVFSVEDLKNKTVKELDSMQFNVHIAGIVYKNRFPELAKEIKDNKWKLSMETYYQDYDVKVGQVIMTKGEAEALGLASANVLGKVARLLKDGKEVAKGEIARVLRGLMFSGCGIVKNPAEPRAVILETAKQKGLDVEELKVEIEGLESTEEKASDEVKVDEDVEEVKKTEEDAALDALDTRQQTSVGICVSYKRFVYDKEPAGPTSNLLHKDWCALYETSCTSPSRGADHNACLRNKIVSETASYLTSRFEDKKRSALLYNLQDLLGQVNKK